MLKSEEGVCARKANKVKCKSSKQQQASQSEEELCAGNANLS